MWFIQIGFVGIHHSPIESLSNRRVASCNVWELCPIWQVMDSYKSRSGWIMSRMHATCNADHLNEASFDMTDTSPFSWAFVSTTMQSVATRCYTPPLLSCSHFCIRFYFWIRFYFFLLFFLFCFVFCLFVTWPIVDTGTDTQDYVSRVEPSVQGGSKMGAGMYKAWSEAMKGNANANANTSERSSSSGSGGGGGAER